MIKAVRQERLLNEIQKQGQVSLADLAKALGVSDITIHRDLEELENEGKLKRVRGGARRISPLGPEPPVILRQQDQPDEKLAIAQKALELVADGEVVALESGSTTLELARAIAAGGPWKNLQVVTNSFPILEVLIHIPGVTVVFLGGMVVPGELGTFGIFAEDMLKKVTINKAFLGCRGLDTQLGLSNSIQSEMEVSFVRSLTSSSNSTVVLADHTKMGKAFLIHMLSPNEIDLVVTDSQTDQHFRDELIEQGVEVIVADVELHLAGE